MNKREIRLPIQLMHTGISQQPETIRLPSQVQDAVNVDFTVEHGASKRPFTKFYHKLSPTPTSSRDVRLHAVERDENERYLIMYGDGNVRVFQEMGVQPPVVVEAVVTTSGDASTYLASGGADGKNIIPVTVNDYTILTNNKVATGLVTSSSYSVSENYKTYGEMISHVQANDTYAKTAEDDDLDALGYYKYSSGSQTFGYSNSRTHTFASGWYAAGGEWDASGNNPMGFRVGFQRLAMAITGGTTASSGSDWTLTRTGAFTSYTFQAGDMIYITGGITTAGWAIIKSRDSNDQITVTPRGSCVISTATGTVTTNGIGIEVDVIENFDSALGNQATTMEEIAKRLEKAMQKAGATNALLNWNYNGGTGYFEIVSQYKGNDSVVRSVLSPNYGATTNIYSLIDANRPFHNFLSFTNVAGTGGNPTTTQSPSSRWTRVPAPSQPQARPDPTKMPVQLVRNYSGFINRSISTTAAGTPTTITSNNHGLTTGQTIVISGNSIPALNTSHVVTVLTANTFTVPATTASGGTGGTFYARAGFTCSTIDWNSRLSGDELNNPAPQPIIDGQTIADVAFVENRMCIAMGQYLVLSQTDDLFNFYTTTYNNAVDSDPIVAPLATNHVVNCKYITPYRDAILVWTFNGEHVEFSWDGILTPTTIRTTQIARSQTWSTRPVRVGEFVYFNSERGSYAEINQYVYDDVVVQNVFTSITTHVPTLVPLAIRSMCSVDAEGALLLLPDDSNKLYVYRKHFTGNTQDQSAWTKYQFDASYRITGMAPIRNAVYLLIQTGSEYTIDCLVYEVPSDTF